MTRYPVKGGFSLCRPSDPPPPLFPDLRPALSRVLTPRASPLRRSSRCSLVSSENALSHCRPGPAGFREGACWLLFLGVLGGRGTGVGGFLGTTACVLHAHPRAQQPRDNTNGNVSRGAGSGEHSGVREGWVSRGGSQDKGTTEDSQGGDGWTEGLLGALGTEGDRVKGLLQVSVVRNTE